jgi:hypothetical protein
MYCTQIAKEAILSVLPEYIARGFMKSALLNITFFAVQQVFCYTGFIRLVIISYSPSSVPSRTYNSTKSAIEIELTICGTGAATLHLSHERGFRQHVLVMRSIRISHRYI